MDPDGAPGAELLVESISGTPAAAAAIAGGVEVVMSPNRQGTLFTRFSAIGIHYRWSWCGPLFFYFGGYLEL